MRAAYRSALIAWLVFQFWSPGVYGAETNAAATSAATSGNNEKETDSRLKWNVDTLVVDYEKHGKHNQKWDESARAALLLFAQVRTFSASPKGPELLSKLESALKAALTNGCDDPLLL